MADDQDSPRHTHLHSHPHSLYPHTLHHEPERHHLTPRSKLSINKRIRVGYLPTDTESKIEQVKEKEKVAVLQAGAIDLRACNICRRKPTVKKELDNFANCEGCGKRTCWVCIRECLGGWGNQMGMGTGGEVRRIEDEKRGIENEENEKESWMEKGTQHRGTVCSKCCVEKGTEGEVLCLACLRVEEEG